MQTQSRRLDEMEEEEEEVVVVVVSWTEETYLRRYFQVLWSKTEQFFVAM